MRYFLSLCFMIFCLSANGQFGASIKYNNNGLSTWNNNFAQDLQVDGSLFNSSLEAGLDYWIRLKNYRVEFFPELSYAISSSESASENLSDMTYQQFGLNFTTHFYLLDFEGDCNCPTWSKDGGFMKKGFFLMLSPGINYNQFALTSPSAEYSENRYSYKIGVGAGIDFGINDLITITPFVMYNFYPSLRNATFNNWIAANVIDPNPILEDDTSSNGQLQFGLRIGFRPDYKY